MSSYEQVLIFPPDISPEQVEEVLAKTKELIEKKSGKIVSQDIWGRRKTAYPLGRYREGVYVILQFTAAPSLIPELEQSHRLNRRIMRHLTVKLDHRIVEKAAAAAAAPVPAPAPTPAPAPAPTK